MTVICATPRLSIRTFSESDISDAFAIMSDPEVARFTSFTPFTYEGTVEKITGMARADPRRIGQWTWFAVELTSSHTLVGSVVLRVDDAINWNAEIGWFFGRPFHGNGYATESVLALIDNAFEHGVKRIYARADQRNVPSHKVMERAGMQKEHHIQDRVFMKNEWCTVVEYAITATDHLKAAGE